MGCQCPKCASGELHLNVRDGRLEAGVPVDQAIVAVDEALPVQAHEGLQDGRAQLLVHGEGKAAPVWRCPQALQLAQDLAAIGVNPLVNLLHEFLTACSAMEAVRGAALITFIPDSSWCLTACTGSNAI